MSQQIVTLRAELDETRRILLEGSIFLHGQRWLALPREVIPEPLSLGMSESVVFEVLKQDSVGTPSFLKCILKAARLETLSMTVMPALSVVAYGIHQGLQPAWGIGILALGGVAFLHVAVNLFNDVQDHLSLTDIRDKSLGGGVLQKGWLNAKQLQGGAWIAVALGVACGVPAGLEFPRLVLPVALVAIFWVFSYSNPPLLLKERILGDLSEFLLGGIALIVGYMGAFFGALDSGVWFLGSCFGFLTWTVRHTHRLCTLRKGNSQNRPASVSVATRLDFQVGRHFLAALYVLMILSMLLGTLLGFFPQVMFFVPVITLGWILPFMRRFYRASGPYSALLVPARMMAANLHFLVCLLLFFGIVVGTYFKS